MHQNIMWKLIQVKWEEQNKTKELKNQIDLFLQLTSKQ